MFEKAYWIKDRTGFGEACPKFENTFKTNAPIKSAVLNITATGVYECHINGSRVGNFILAPGWTAYHLRHQYQSYDVTHLLSEENLIEVTVGKGWYRSGLTGDRYSDYYGGVSALIAELDIVYEDESVQRVVTNSFWQVSESKIRFSEIYDGETYDATFEPADKRKVGIFCHTKEVLIPQEGEFVTEQEHLKPIRRFKTPKGEDVIDFGQNLTGYVSFTVNAKKGDRLVILHAEELDSDGNFYTANLRSAKQKTEYICCDGKQSYKPKHTFMGFRYIRLVEAPADISTDSFEAIVVHSDMKRTGYFKCSNPKLNRWFENVIWGQKDNFLDVPTDCPQRDERLGWTGDAQIFVKTASYNFDVKKFFKKWLRDLAAEQWESGCLPRVIPNVLGSLEVGFAGWIDAAVVCPWQIYVTYGDTEVLENQLESMIKTVEYMRRYGENEYLWQGGPQLGDWLALDAKPGNLGGASRVDFVASCSYANCTRILADTLKVLGRDDREYRQLYEGIVTEFKKTFNDYETQTECVLALNLGLTDRQQYAADKLVQYLEEKDRWLMTGFIGTPYILYALSENGYADFAYTLMLREEYPSWLFSVNRGATTIWEHWDSKKADGTILDMSMNSFNHYAFGATAAWLYEVVLGIRVDEAHPGFEKIRLLPRANKALSFAEGSIETVYGTIRSRWEIKGDKTYYEFDIPTEATLILGDKVYNLFAGKHKFEE